MASTYISLPATEVTGTVDVHLNPLNDAVAISDGIDQLEINGDGSINVILGGSVSNTYNAVTNVATSVLTTVVSYTATAFAKVRRVSANGENVAKFDVTVNGNVQGVRRSFFGDLNVEFEFEDGLALVPGDLVLVRVIHERPNPGNFEANILIHEG